MDFYDIQQEAFERRELSRMGPDDAHDFAATPAPGLEFLARPLSPLGQLAFAIAGAAAKTVADPKHYAGDDRDQT